MMVLDKTWIYSFGGATNDFNGNPNGFEIERLNTELIEDGFQPVTEESGKGK